MFDTYNFTVTSYNFASGDFEGTTTAFKDMSIEQLDYYFAPEDGFYKGRTLWTVSLLMTTEYQSISAECDIVFSNIEGQDKVYSIDLDKTEIVFGAEE